MTENHQVAYLLQLADMLDSHRKTSYMTDIILVCEEKDFPAHKLILSANSNYFRAMFASGWEENKSMRINLPSVDAKEMEIILSFLYTGKFEDTDDEALLKALLVTSHFLQVNALFERCFKRLSERFSCNNFLEICNLAFEFNEERMTEHVLSILAQRFEDIAASEEFLKLNACQMLKICQHPDTLKCSMDVVIKGLFRWTEADEEREDTLLQILTMLDLKRMSSDFLSENLRERTLVKKNYHVLTLLTAEATSRLLTSSSKNIEKAEKGNRILTFGRNPYRHLFRMYDVKLNQWSSSKTLPFNLKFYSPTVWFEGHVYFLGGGDIFNIEISADIIKYCPETNTGSSVATLAVPVTEAGAGVLGEYIYVVSGLNKDRKGTCIVQRYNPVVGTCDLTAPTNRQYIRPRVLPFAKYLLLVGSSEGENSVERYDPECDEWTFITAIPGQIDLCSAAIVKEKLFVVPKRRTSTFQIYDISSARWEKKQLDVRPRVVWDVYASTIEGKCILMFRGDKSVLHSLDPALNQWLSRSDPNSESWDDGLTCVA